MAAPNNKFTEEQIEILRESKYVRSVGERQVYFTEEFKRVYWEMYTVENLMPVEILRRLGIDYRLLGTRRIQGLSYNLKKQHERDGDFSGRRGTAPPIQRARRTPEQKIEKLQAENEYLKQELEFIKKIVAIGGEVKQ